MTHLGFAMEASKGEAGEHLFLENDKHGNDEMIIIYDGMVELYSTMDNGTEFAIEYLYKGSIINPNTFITT